MSWYSETAGTINFSHRWPVAVNNLSGTSPINISIALPPDWDDFWDNVLASGADVRAIDADGETLLTYDINAFNKTTRAGTLRIGSYTPPSSDAVCLVWIYWGNATVLSGAATPATSSQKAGTIYQGCPVGGRLIGAAQEGVGATNPAQVVVKTSTETIQVWWRLNRKRMARRCSPWVDKDVLEELDYVTVGVDLATSDQTALYTESDTRFLEADNGDMLIRTTYKAGSNAQTYTAILTVGTTDSGTATVRDYRAQLKIQDTVEP